MKRNQQTCALNLHAINLKKRKKNLRYKRDSKINYKIEEISKLLKPFGNFNMKILFEETQTSYGEVKRN